MVFPCHFLHQFSINSSINYKLKIGIGNLEPEYQSTLYNHQLMFLEASQHLQVQEVTVMLLEAAEIREHHLPFKHLFVTSLQRMKRDLVSLRMTDLRLELPSEP